MSIHKDLQVSMDLGDAYGFFKSFPRNVRDNIYEHLYDETSGAFEELGVRIRLPVVGLRLINRHFKLEYDHICATNERLSHFVLNDDTYFGKKSLAYRWQTLTPGITNMEIDLSMCFCKHGCICLVEKRLSESALRIQKIMEDMPKLRRLRVRFALAHRRCLIAALRCVNQYRQIPKLKELTFTAGDGDSKRTLWIWTEQGGMVQNRQAIDQLS